MTTPDTPTPYRAKPEQWRHAAIGLDSPAMAETRGAIKALREALAALERRVGALEELTTTALADVADAFERAAQQITPAAAPSPSAGSLLVEVVARAIEQCDAPENASKAAIAAVAGWLDSNAGLPELATPKESDGWQMAAQILSQEARK